jgi:hypothetical protein
MCNREQSGVDGLVVQLCSTPGRVTYHMKSRLLGDDVELDFITRTVLRTGTRVIPRAPACSRQEMMKT